MANFGLQIYCRDRFTFAVKLLYNICPSLDKTRNQEKGNLSNRKPDRKEIAEDLPRLRLLCCVARESRSMGGRSVSEKLGL